jgi:UDP-glucose 4-epimerase
MTTQSETPTNELEDEPTIAITGAAGYIGSRVIVEMQEAHPEWELIALDSQVLRAGRLGWRCRNRARGHL